MKKIIALLISLSILVYIVGTAFTTVEETEIAIVTFFSKPVRVVAEAGLLIKWPDPINSVIRIDRRIQSLDSPIVEYLTQDKKNVVASSFILWRVADPERFIQSVRDLPAAERRLTDLAGSELGAAVSNYPLSDLLTTAETGSKIDEMIGKVAASVRERARKDYGIEIVTVRLRRLGFPPENLTSVYNRMRSERERIANKYRAEGEEEASYIRSETDKQTRELISKAYREAQEKKGAGEAEAMKIYAAAYGKDAEFYKFMRTMEAYRKILDQKTTLILSTDAPLFNYLEKPPRER